MFIEITYDTCTLCTKNWTLKRARCVYVLTQIADDSSVNKQGLTDKKITAIVNQVNINQRLHVTVKKDLEN